MTSPASAARAEGLTKHFGKGPSRVTALDNVSLDACGGEFVAVMGASGSGKSTLLHLLAGLTAPSAGRAFIGGNDLARMSDRKMTLFRRRHVGLVFQSYNLIPTLSAEDNLKLPLLLGGDGHSQSTDADGLLRRLGLWQRRRHRPDQLSGGEQQRLAIGRALVNNPSVVLADEPTGNLDSTASRGICELLRSLSADQNRTIIMVTHDPTVAIWAARTLILTDGRIIAELQGSEFSTARELGVRFQEIVSEAEEVAGCD